MTKIIAILAAISALTASQVAFAAKNQPAANSENMKVLMGGYDAPVAASDATGTITQNNYTGSVKPCVATATTICK